MRAASSSASPPTRARQSTSYTDDTAQPLRRYRYRIKAVNQHGASQWSRFAGAETPEAPVEESQRDTAPGPKTEDSGSADEAVCPDRGTEPTPVTVAVDAVPIVVASTTADYFVLYVTFDLDGAAVDLPVLVKRGAGGRTILAENVRTLPPERYRVEKYRIANPADVDGDCIDDISELADPVGVNPVNPAPAIAFQRRRPDPFADLAIIGGALTFAIKAKGNHSSSSSCLGWDTDAPECLLHKPATRTLSIKAS